VRVRDTGVGIPPEFLPHVFEPFTREDRPAVRNRPGTGVGLLAVRRIVELHGGRVEVASPAAGWAASSRSGCPWSPPPTR
jgi:signal transduction histidine kinase